MRCPECKSTTRKMRTKNISEYLRQITHACRNEDCQMTFITQEEFIRIVQPPKLNEKAKHPI